MKLKNILKHIKNRTFIKRMLECRFYLEISHHPNMTWPEYNLIRSIIQITKPKRCLEWGSGFSTKYFAELVGQWKGDWTAIEYDKKWYKKALKTKAMVYHIPPNNLGWVNAPHPEGTYEDFKDYVDFPKRRYDFVLIDGRAKEVCFKRALTFTDGIIVLHNVNISGLSGFIKIGRIGIYKCSKN